MFSWWQVLAILSLKPCIRWSSFFLSVITHCIPSHKVSSKSQSPWLSWVLKLIHKKNELYTEARRLMGVSTPSTRPFIMTLLPEFVQPEPTIWRDARLP